MWIVVNVFRGTTPLVWTFDNYEEAKTEFDRLGFAPKTITLLKVDGNGFTDIIEHKENND